MNQIIITRNNSTLRGNRRTTLASKISVGQNTLILVLIVLITLVSLLYLVHQNASATKGYALKVLDFEYEELLQKNEVWNMRIASSKAMRTVTGSEVVQGMTIADEVEYVSVPNEQ